MEREDKAVLSEVRIEMDMSVEPAEYWTTQQQGFGESCKVLMENAYKRLKN
jgi:hypothetical protein